MLVKPDCVKHRRGYQRHSKFQASWNFFSREKSLDFLCSSASLSCLLIPSVEECGIETEKDRVRERESPGLEDKQSHARRQKDVVYVIQF